MNTQSSKPYIIAFLLRKKTIMLTTSVAILGLVITNIWMAATLSHKGITLKELDRRSQDLQARKIQLEQQIYRFGSLHDLEQRAQAMGFSSEVTYHQLDQSQSVALGY